QQSRKHESDGTLAGNENSVAFQKGQPSNRFEHRVNRFEHGTFQMRIGAWNPHHAREHEGHYTHIFRVASARGLESCGDACPLILVTLGKGFVSAGMTFEARHMMMERHTVTHSKTPDRCPYAHNGARRLVTENARRSNRAMLDLLNVGRT